MNFIKAKKDIDASITNIVKTIRDLNWDLKQIWVENNCIYADVQKLNGKKEQEGLYAGSEDDTNNIYNVFSKLRYALNFNGMLNNDNVLI